MSVPLGSRPSNCQCLVSLWVLFTLASFDAHAGDILYSQPVFAREDGAEFQVQMRASAPGTSWQEDGREAALLKVFIDDRYDQHVIVLGGAEETSYDFLVGPLNQGSHRLRIEWDNSWTPVLKHAPEIRALSLLALDRSDPALEPILRAPILYIRKDTWGHFSDVPLLLYWEAEDRPSLPRKIVYTAVFSNEDGGTDTELLMARWGRTTDIEWCFSYSSSEAYVREEFQGPDHKTSPFRGKKDAWHPILYDATTNNNFSDSLADAPEFRVRLVPAFVDLLHKSRESVMDRFPWTYRIMAQEITREKKIENPSDPLTAAISDPRNYAYLDICSGQRGTALFFELQLKGGSRWFSSDHGNPKARIGRSGCVRSTVELPPGVRAEDLRALRIQCLEALPDPNHEPVRSPEAEIQTVNKLFLLGEDYRPGPNLLGRLLRQRVTPGQSLTLPIR